MIAIERIDHVVLRTAQLETMLEFYAQVLGARLERSLEDLGLYQLRAGASLIDVVDVSAPLGKAGGAAPGEDARNLDHFCLKLVDFDADVINAHLRHCGVEPGEVAQRYGAEGTGPSIYIKDPDGNTVELKGPPEPRSLLSDGGTGAATNL